jgi:aminopeptidase N
MLIMDGSASEGLIVHEMTHQYAHGILANNEWKEAWLDEGVTSFIDGWYAEEHGSADVWDRFMERTGRSEPAPMAIANPSEDFPNYSVYGYLSYTKPQAVLYMLRELLGKETMRQVLKTYYDRYAFRHVNEAALRSVASEVARRDLGWFFDQWLHTTATLDWSVEEARTIRASSGDEGDGDWRTEVTLRREGEAWMPVTLRLRGDGSTRDVRVESRDRRVTVEVPTPWKPSSAELDPERAILDVDRSNDRAEVRAAGDRTGDPDPR